MINPLEAINYLTQLKEALTLANNFIQIHPCPDATDKTEDLYCRYKQTIRFLDIQKSFLAIQHVLECVESIREKEARLMHHKSIEDAIFRLQPKPGEALPDPVNLGLVACAQKYASTPPLTPSVLNRLTALEIRVGQLETKLSGVPKS